MNNEECGKIKQYLEKNFKSELGLGEQVLDFITENSLKTIFTDIGASLFASIIGNTQVSKNNKSSSELEKDNANREKLVSWMNRQMGENDSFQKKLFVLMKQKGYDEQPSKFYNKIFLDRRVFSRISSEAYEQQPEKKTVFKLIIGLELTLYDAEDLLKSAGFSFNCHKKFDMIIKYCVENEIFKPEIVDEYLIIFGEKPLFSIE